ncbi:MAG: hypothetical protein ACI90V_009843 [Bacillariaceae sp.]|jgi:hypothetical protein
MLTRVLSPLTDSATYRFFRFRLKPSTKNFQDFFATYHQLSNYHNVEYREL